jgi:hypothetical protein
MAGHVVTSCQCSAHLALPLFLQFGHVYGATRAGGHTHTATLAVFQVKDIKIIFIIAFEHTLRTILQAAVTFITHAATQTTLCLIDSAFTIGSRLETKMNLVKTATPHKRIKGLDRFRG